MMLNSVEGETSQEQRTLFLNILSLLVLTLHAQVVLQLKGTCPYIGVQTNSNNNQLSATDLQVQLNIYQITAHI
jgi:hypothetical protein